MALWYYTIHIAKRNKLGLDLYLALSTPRHFHLSHSRYQSIAHSLFLNPYIIILYRFHFCEFYVWLSYIEFTKVNPISYKDTRLLIAALSIILKFCIQWERIPWFQLFEEVLHIVESWWLPNRLSWNVCIVNDA